MPSVRSIQTTTGDGSAQSAATTTTTTTTTVTTTTVVEYAAPPPILSRASAGFVIVDNRERGDTQMLFGRLCLMDQYLKARTCLLLQGGKTTFSNLRQYEETALDGLLYDEDSFPNEDAEEMGEDFWDWVDTASEFVPGMHTDVVGMMTLQLIE